MIVGISIEDAVVLANKYEQNAFLHYDYKCDEEAIPRLVFPDADGGYYVRNNPMERMTKQLNADLRAKGFEVVIKEVPGPSETLTATIPQKRSEPQFIFDDALVKSFDVELLFKLVGQPGSIINSCDNDEIDDETSVDFWEVFREESVVVGQHVWDSGGPGAGAENR